MIFKKKGNTLFGFGDTHYLEYKIIFDGDINSITIARYKLNDAGDVNYFNDWETITESEAMQFMKEVEFQQTVFIKQINTTITKIIEG